MSGDNHPFKSRGELNAFLRVYETIKDRMAATVWLFETSDFHVLCNADIAFVDEVVPPANVVKYSFTTMKDEGNKEEVIKFVRVHAKNLRQLLRHILLVRHFRLEIFKSGSNGSSYERTATASPSDRGDVKDLLFAEDDAEYAEALRLGPVSSIVIAGDAKEPQVGMAFWHDATKSVQLAEFYDNMAMDLLESVIIQYTPVECVLSGNSKYKTVRAVLSRNKVLMTTESINKSEFERSLKEIERIGNIEKEHKLAQQALANLFVHLKLSEETTLEHGAKFIDTQEFVRFNSRADEGLNIFDAGLHGFSLFKVLNKTRTSGGERLLKVWLRQPLTDVRKIRERLDIVEQLVENSSCRKTLHEALLRKMPDLESLAIKLIDKRGQLVDLYKIYLAVNDIEKMTELFGQLRDENNVLNEHFGIPFVKKLDKMEQFQNLVKTTLDFESITKENVFIVKAAFDDNLMKTKSEMDDIKEAIEKSASKMASSLNLDKKNLKLDWSTQHGYCFRVTLKDEKNLRSKSGIIVVDSTKAGVRFRNRDLESMNREFCDLKDDYDKQQQSVINEIMSIAYGYAPFITELGHLISMLDCFVSLAVAAISAPVPYSKPEIIERAAGSGVLQLDEARHPCLELMDNINYIPNSCDFKSAEKTFCIITGPNLGGKSTYLRSVALNVIMAQVGSFVASSRAKLFPVDRILVRIGAGDSQLTGVSTFMAEMLEASAIVRSATEHSLIIIDELGRGTSTYDGLGLAWSISHHVASEIKAFSLFATHFHEITKLSDELPNVFNCFVDAIADEGQFTLLYNVRPGSSNKSFGLEVARLAGFPSEVMADARHFLAQAEMPILRSGKSTSGLDSREVRSFLDEWKKPSTSEKRKKEMIEMMKSKVAKIEEELCA